MHYSITYEPADNFSAEREIIYKCDSDEDCLRKVLAQIINISDDPEIRPSSKLSKDDIDDITGDLTFDEMIEVLDNSEEDSYAFVSLITREDGKVIYHFS